MRHGFSFRSRVLLSFILVIALGVLAPAWYFRSVLMDELVEEGRADAERLLQMGKHALIMSGLSDASDGASAVRNTLNNLAQPVDISMAYWDMSGNRIAVAGNLDDVRAVPASMLQEGRSGDFEPDRFRVDTSGMFDKARVLAWCSVVPGTNTTIPAGYIGLTLPTLGAGHKLSRINQGLFSALAAASLLAGMIGFVLVRWMWRSMQELVSVAESIGKGNYTERAGDFACREFSDLGRSINLMAMRIEAHIATITDQKEQFEAVLNSMNEGVMVLDASCRILSVNRALKNIFPDTENAEGRRPLEVIPSPELQKACLEVSKVRGQARIMRTFQIEPRKDAVYDVAIVSLGRDGGSPDDLGAVAVFHDISTLSRLERVRSDFVANVSHELRTPLTSIKGYAETLLDSMDSEVGNPGAQKAFMEIILRNANHMSKMVNDLLNLARLEGGKRPFEAREIDASLALAQAYKECLHLAGDRNVSLDLEVEKGTAMVMADNDRLAQVFRNLLENAIKYGNPLEDATPAKVKVRCEQRETDVMFAIEDNGPGIPKEERQRIFERFYRVEKHRAKDCSGSSGLGLAITRHMVEKMGGEIWVQSPAADGTGSIFCFTLPKNGVSVPMLV